MAAGRLRNVNSSRIQGSLLEEFCLPVEAGDLDADGSWRQDPSKAMPCASQDTSAKPESSSVPRGIQAKTEQLSESCGRNAVTFPLRFFPSPRCQ